VILIAIPYCHSDLELQRTNLEWMGRLGKQPTTCLLSTEEGVEDLSELASKAFEKVELLRYTPFEGPKTWPQPQNYAWQSAARHMYQNGKQPWFWLESDVCPLTKDWVKKLKEGYEAGGKPFAGCVVKHPQVYCAGPAIYPWNVLEYSPTVMRCRAAPFDVAMASETLAHTYDMQHLIDHRRAPGQIFEHPDDLKMIRRGAVVFHKAKDGALQSLLMGKQPPPRQVPPSTDSTAFYHSGNLGDIIYSLYAIKKHGGGHLIIGPDQRDSELCSNPVDEKAFAMLKPLLDDQPYLRSVTFKSSRPKEALNLNCFRNYWLNTSIRARSKADSLCKMHFYLLSILDRYKDDEPWLDVVPSYCMDLKGRIIVSRSWRHRNYDFPWAQVKKKFGDRLLFVGLEKEKNIWEMCWGRIDWAPVNDFLDLARIIKQADGFIGNQSFGMAIAIALGQNVLQEVYDKAPDCLFSRKNFVTDLNKFKP